MSSENQEENNLQQYKYIKDYEIIERIGAGSFGLVYKVKKKNTSKILVIKQIPFTTKEEDINQLLEAQNEAKILSELNNKFIVKYYESFEENNNLDIVMEYCEGGDLSTYIQRIKKANKIKNLQESQIWKFFIQLSIGLSYVHYKKIIHRDLKSLNIFLTKNLDVKIGDFGVGKILKNTMHAHTFIGTPYYLSPEILEEKPYNEKSDVWALGCILYELCTFQHPYNASNQAALFLKIKDSKYAPISNCFSNEIKKMISILLDKNYFTRPSMKQIIEMPIFEEKCKFYGLINERNDILKLYITNITNLYSNNNMYNNETINRDNVNTSNNNNCNNNQQQNNNNYHKIIKPKQIKLIKAESCKKVNNGFNIASKNSMNNNEEYKDNKMNLVSNNIIIKDERLISGVKNKKNSPNKSDNIINNIKNKIIPPMKRNSIDNSNKKKMPPSTNISNNLNNNVNISSQINNNKLMPTSHNSNLYVNVSHDNSRFSTGNNSNNNNNKNIKYLNGKVRSNSNLFSQHNNNINQNYNRNPSTHHLSNSKNSQSKVSSERNNSKKSINTSHNNGHSNNSSNIKNKNYKNISNNNGKYKRILPSNNNEKIVNDLLESEKDTLNINDLNSGNDSNLETPKNKHSMLNVNKRSNFENNNNYNNYHHINNSINKQHDYIINSESNKRNPNPSNYLFNNNNNKNSSNGFISNKNIYKNSSMRKGYSNEKSSHYKLDYFEGSNNNNINKYFVNINNNIHNKNIRNQDKEELYKFIEDLDQDNKEIINKVQRDNLKDNLRYKKNLYDNNNNVDKLPSFKISSNYNNNMQISDSNNNGNSKHLNYFNSNNKNNFRNSNNDVYKFNPEKKIVVHDGGGGVNSNLNNNNISKNDSKSKNKNTNNTNSNNSICNSRNNSNNKKKQHSKSICGKILNIENPLYIERKENKYLLKNENHSKNHSKNHSIEQNSKIENNNNSNLCNLDSYDEIPNINVPSPYPYKKEKFENEIFNNKNKNNNLNLNDIKDISKNEIKNNDNLSSPTNEFFVINNNNNNKQKIKSSVLSDDISVDRKYLEATPLKNNINNLNNSSLNEDDSDNKSQSDFGFEDEVCSVIKNQDSVNMNIKNKNDNSNKKGELENYKEKKLEQLNYYKNRLMSYSNIIDINKLLSIYKQTDNEMENIDNVKKQIWDYINKNLPENNQDLKQCFNKYILYEVEYNKINEIENL